MIHLTKVPHCHKVFRSHEDVEDTSVLKDDAPFEVFNPANSLIWGAQVSTESEDDQWYSLLNSDLSVQSIKTFVHHVATTGIGWLAISLPPNKNIKKKHRFTLVVSSTTQLLCTLSVALVLHCGGRVCPCFLAADHSRCQLLNLASGC
jgi:hypothetical protein